MLKLNEIVLRNRTADTIGFMMAEGGLMLAAIGLLVTVCSSRSVTVVEKPKK